MATNDLVIRGATVVDGLGHDPVRADVAVKDGRIAAIGEIGSDAAEIVDAGGLALMPGIIDIHTHYDAQVTWDPTLSPSPSLGVTTVVMGNCGFGIVPSPPPLRDLIMRNLAVVEGMDLDALRAGIDWRFQSFAEYLDAVRRAGPYANLAVLVGHSAVRTAVMGEDASVRKEPTAAELAEMKRLVARGDGPGRDRARRLVFAEPFRLGRHPDAVDDQRHLGIRGAGRRDGRPGARRRRDRLGHDPGRDDRRDRRPARPPHVHDHRAVVLQRAVPDARHRHVRGLRSGAGARPGSLPAVHLPAAVVRFHAGRRLSVLQPSGLRPDQGL